MPTHQDLTELNRDIAEHERKIERPLIPFGVVIFVLAIGFIAALISLYAR